MDSRFGLKTHCIADIINILKLHPEVEEALIFGSRAMGTYKNGSDIDIALKGEKINFDTISTIRLRLDELTYAYMYDVIDYKKVSNPSVTAHIEELGIVFYKKELLPSVWKTYKLSDVVEIKYGKDHKHLADGEIPLYGSGGIMRYVNTPLYEQESILIPRKGTLSNLFYLNIPFWSVDTMFYTKIKEGNNGKYLYYLLKSMDLASMNVGSAVPSLTTEVLNKVEINVPDEATQIEIAHILTSLDDKIELNLQMNQTLEAMAQAVFKEWFVNFNFPNFDDELENGLPKGWRIGRTDDLFILQRGFDLPAITRTEGTYPVVAASGISTYHHEYKVKGPGVTTGRSGVLGKVYYITEDFWPLNTSLFIKEYKNSTPLFAYHILREMKLLQLNGGSAVPTLNRNDVHGIECIIPHISIINQFEIIAKDMFKKIQENKIQIQALTQIRDTLLPKLMSGKLKLV